MPANHDLTPWHTLPLEDTLRETGTSRTDGLTDEEANRRLATDGPNELKESGGRGLRHIIWEQVSSTMIVVLLIAGVLAWFLKGGDGLPIDAIAIFAIVILFVVLGVLQEYRAQKAIAALKKLSAPNVRVIRGGALREISARDLVRGDLVQIETGGVIPADCRIVENVNLRVQEAALTGESEPVEKTDGVLTNAEAGVGDRTNMLFSGTHVTYGRGSAVVVSTGMKTELGKIASLLQAVHHDPTPLQKRLDRLGKTLAILAVIIAALVGVTGMAEGKTVAEILILAVSIAVAIIPEGLPAVLTFSLAIGAQRMLRRKALIRKLPAVETLGSVTVVCSDKTGTLTMNRMTVTRLATADSVEPFAAGDRITGDRETLLRTATLCSDATVSPSGEGVGDPTEIAIVVAAGSNELAKSRLESEQPRVHEFPFDSDRKKMTTVHKAPDQSIVAYTKGAADQMLAVCDSAEENGKVVPLTPELRQRIEEMNRGMAREGIRVLGVARRTLERVPETLDPSTVETGLTFLGLIGMIDPPRPEAKAAVARCHTAGIQVKMITGDHPETALTIARELGIAGPESRAVTGVELERMEIAEIRAIARETAVFARVSPEHKLKIVQALQENGEVVAMTGDGVNDAPALKKADIGIAMGITGTDVAKEAADMVLVDDNFATIVNAVEEGRVVFDNLRRFIMFSLAGNVAKVLVVAVPPLLGMMAMLKPIQILFSNLLTDGLLGLGIGMEAAEKNTMTRPPYSPKESVFSRGVGIHVAVVGPVVGLLFIALGAWQWNAMGLPALLADDPDRSGPAFLLWGTLMFTALAFMQIVRVFCSRSFTDAAWKTPLRANPTLLGMAALTLVLQLAAVLLAPVHSFFHTIALPIHLFALAIVVALLVFFLMEMLKALLRRTVA
ncbi:MAG: cation-translocating P-type ATPase [Terrimicrobiaceae bacterium]|nr:cation-translocating P-type ATPase [Terrimicrobiaceae bacterium]